MSWVVVGLATVGAGAGYFGTSKKNRKKDGLKNAALGAIGGATLGFGTGAMMGAKAGTGALSAGTSAFNSGTSSALASNATMGMTPTVGYGALTPAVGGTTAPIAGAGGGWTMAGLKTNAGNFAKQQGLGMLEGQTQNFLSGGNKEQVAPADIDWQYQPQQVAYAPPLAYSPYYR